MLNFLAVVKPINKTGATATREYFRWIWMIDLETQLAFVSE